MVEIGQKLQDFGKAQAPEPRAFARVQGLGWCMRFLCYQYPFWQMSYIFQSEMYSSLVGLLALRIQLQEF